MQDTKRHLDDQKSCEQPVVTTVYFSGSEEDDNDDNDDNGDEDDDDDDEDDAPQAHRKTLNARKDNVSPEKQAGPETELELEIGTAGTVFPGTERGTGTPATALQEPKPELEPSLSTKLC